MTYENFIGLRYLMAKRRSRVVSVITLISIAGVALGVTAMIVVLSVMGGFKKDLKEKILGTKAHIVVKAKDHDALKNPQKVVDASAKFDKIVGASPFIEAEVMASSPTNLNGVMLRGIEPDQIGEVSDLDTALECEEGEGKLEYLHDPKPLLERLEKEQEKERLALQEEIESARKEIEEERKKSDSLMVGGERDAGSLGNHEPDAGEAETVGETQEEDEGGMPPIVPSQGDSEGGSEEEAGGGMPPIAPGGSDESEGGGSMPSITGDETEESSALPGIIVGKELAKSLQVELGDEINVVTPQGEMGPTGPIPRSRPFRVVGIFYTGMYEYDANYAYTTIVDARDFLDRQGVTGVELKTNNVDQAIPMANKLQEILPETMNVLDWKEMNRSLFYALKLEKIAMFVVLTFIILVASFSIIAMLIMIVLEKKRDISVLKSMGMTDGGIMRIFVYQGVVIGAIGATLGLILGLTICFLLVEFGFPLDSEVYYISTLPVEINPVEVVLVVVCTILISFIATIYPSWKASKLRPVEGLRYE